MNRRTFLAAAALAPGGFCPPPAFGQPKEKVKIVSVLPRTGGSKGVTDGIVNAINLALADFEKALPFEVVHVERDDAHPRRGAWDVDRETSIAAAAAADRDVLAVIGSYDSGAARVSAPIFNKAGLVQVSPSATLTGLTKSGPASDADEPGKYRPAQKITFCRVCPYDGSQGVLSAQFAAAELKAQSVYVLDDKQLYGSGAAGVFKKQCEALKLKVAGAESVSITQSDFGPLTQRIKDKNPDLVYFGGTIQSKAGQLAREMVRAQLACPLVLPDACYEDAFIDSAGRALDALKVFVPQLEQAAAWARPMEHRDTANQYLVATELLDDDQHSLHGLATGTSPIEAAARSTLHALNRTIAPTLDTLSTTEDTPFMKPRDSSPRVDATFPTRTSPVT